MSFNSARPKEETDIVQVSHRPRTRPSRLLAFLRNLRSQKALHCIRVPIQHFCIPVAATPHIAAVFICRFIAGFVSAIPRVTGSSSIRDLLGAESEGCSLGGVSFFVDGGFGDCCWAGLW